MRRSAGLLVLVGVAACGGDDGAAPAVDATTADSAATSLTATAGATTRTFEHAFYGITSSAGGDALYLEAHAGGEATCPEQASPTPQQSLVIPLTALPPASGGAFTANVSLFDFEGAFTTGLAPLHAPAATIDVTSFDAGAGSVTFTTSFTLAATADSPAITVAGGLTAPHCASLDADE